MAEPNLVLAALIERAGLSHAGLAARINQATGGRTRYDHASVARWIRDYAIPRDPAPEAIREILEQRLNQKLSLADLGFLQSAASSGNTPLTRSVERATALWRRDGSPRGAALAQTGGVQAIAPVWEWENPPEDADVSHLGDSPVSAESIRRLRRLRSHYQEMYRRVGGLPVRHLLVRTLNHEVAPLFRGAYDNELGRELHRAVGGLVALAGIFAYDADQYALAQRYLFDALRMAKASGDRQFGTYVVGLLATHALQRDERLLTVQYAETGLRVASSLSPALVADLHTLAGKAYARMGDSSACSPHMRESERLAGLIRPSGEPEEVSYVQPGLVETQIAEALRRLGNHTAALPYARESARTATTSHLRGRVHRFAGLALILAEHGEIEESAHVAGTMLDHAEGMESARIRDRIDSVMSLLRPHTSVPGISDLIERVDDSRPTNPDLAGEH
jgi:hypothetical protein